MGFVRRQAAGGSASSSGGYPASDMQCHHDFPERCRLMGTISESVDGRGWYCPYHAQVRAGRVKLNKKALEQFINEARNRGDNRWNHRPLVEWWALVIGRMTGGRRLTPAEATRRQLEREFPHVIGERATGQMDDEDEESVAFPTL